MIRDLCLALSLNTKPQAFALPQQIPVQKLSAPGRVENRYQAWAAELDNGRAKQHSYFGPLLMHYSGIACYQPAEELCLSTKCRAEFLRSI